LKYIFLLAAFFTTQVFAQFCGNEIELTAFDSRYDVDLADQSIVTDLSTGLVWRRCPEGYTFNDSGTIDNIADDSCDLPEIFLDNDLENDSDNGDQIVWNWLQAFERVDEQGSPWRVPNVKELVSLVEHACSAPSINTRVFLGFESITSISTQVDEDGETVLDDEGLIARVFTTESVASSALWTSTPDPNTETNAWIVTFSDGSNTTVSKFTNLFLRLVRDQ